MAVGSVADDEAEDVVLAAIVHSLIVSRDRDVGLEMLGLLTPDDFHAEWRRAMLADVAAAYRMKVGDLVVLRGVMRRGGSWSMLEKMTATMWSVYAGIKATGPVTWLGWWLTEEHRPRPAMEYGSEWLPRLAAATAKRKGVAVLERLLVDLQGQEPDVIGKLGEARVALDGLLQRCETQGRRKR